MVVMTFPAVFTEDFVKLIPQQRAQIVELLTEGKLASFSLNANRTQAWMVVRARTEEEVDELLESFPMYDYFEYEVEPLVLYDTEMMGLPQITLN